MVTPNTAATKKTILVVDDDGDILELVARGLQARYQVHTVPSSFAAIRDLEEVTPDLVVIDLYMPNFAGIDLITFLHRQAPQLPIIAISGNAVHLLEKALEAGAIAKLTKTFSVETDLMPLIANCLKD